MNLGALRQQLQLELLSFCWREWAQMGLLADRPPVLSPWAQDPEALIVLTLEVARADPRLFDELMDWMALNERLLSVRRMRAMCLDDEDQALVTSIEGWLSQQRRKGSTQLAPATWDGGGVELRPLFDGGGPLRELDPSFAAAGLARPILRRSDKASRPDLSRPINLSLRLRAILGVGIRAEVVRIMLGMPKAWVSAQALSRSSAFSKRNVHDAVAGLAEARVIAVADAGSELRYRIDVGAWAALLGYGLDELPVYREWRALLGIMRQILRWTGKEIDPPASDYMQASATRQLLQSLRVDLASVGLALPVRLTAEDAPVVLREIVGKLLADLTVQGQDSPVRRAS